MAGRIEVIQGDITKQKVDAIVNAANNTLKLLKKNNMVEKIIFVCFNKEVYDGYIIVVNQYSG